MSRRSFSEGGLQPVTFVYILQSEVDPAKFYVGMSSDPARRLEEHNAGKSIHTNKYRPWRLTVTIAFADAAKAITFERYLKSGSGRAFAKKHF
jgi:predicted GIY-YIG superfamily endonuclease